MAKKSKFFSLLQSVENILLGIFLKDQWEKKLPIFVDIQKVHEKWSIFCFYGIFRIVAVFEIIAFEIVHTFRCNTQTFLNF